MKPDLECASCALKWVYERAAVLADREARFLLSRSILRTLSQQFHSGTNLGLMYNKIVNAADKFMPDSSRYYKPLKLRTNQHAKELLSPAKDFIDQGETDREKLNRMCCLAAASNVAPIGVVTEALNFQEVKDILEKKKPYPVVMDDVFETLKTAKHILYVTDNAGEIGFDSLLISKLKEMGSRITLLVKEDSFFEDATIEDAAFFHLDSLVDDLLTVKGLFVPPVSPPSLKNSLDKSNLIISKGTGNFEALRDEVNGKPAIFMLKIKCKPVAAITNVDIGNFIVQIQT